MYCGCPAPSGYPQNVTVRQFNESSVLVQWLPPPVDQRNGLISAYQVIRRWINNALPLLLVIQQAVHFPVLPPL